MTEHLDLDELVKILGHNLPTAAPSATQVSAPRSSWLQDVNASSPTVRISPIAEAMVPACMRRVSRVVQANFPRRLKWLAAIFAEFQRAIAAARRYEELKLHHGSVVQRHDIANHIFEEFYSHMDHGGFAPSLTALLRSQPAPRRCRRLVRRL